MQSMELLMRHRIRRWRRKRVHQQRTTNLSFSKVLLFNSNVLKGMGDEIVPCALLCPQITHHLTRKRELNMP